ADGDELLGVEPRARQVRADPDAQVRRDAPASSRAGPGRDPQAHREDARLLQAPSPQVGRRSGLSADLARRVEAIAAAPEQSSREETRSVFEELKAGLNAGSIRAAEKRGDRWTVNRWVKQGILLGFRIGTLTRVVTEAGFPFFDKDTFPVKDLRLESKV